MGTSYYRACTLPVTGSRLVAWQVDLRRQPRPVRLAKNGPRVVRLERLTGSENGDPRDHSGVRELILSLEARGWPKDKR